MAETPAVVATLLVVAGVAGGAPAAAFVGGPGVDGQVGTDGLNGTDASAMAPGERLGAVVGVERAAVAGELASRAFGQRVAAAASNDSRAAVVDTEIADLRERLANLSAERAALERAYENGSVSRGEYRARLAGIHAERRTLQRLANETAQVADALPAARLRENGVNVTALRTVRAEAANLTGPEVAALARSVAGPSAGMGLGPSATTGPPAFVENRTGETGPPADAGAAGASGDGGPPRDGNGTGPAGAAGPPDDGNATGTPGGDGGSGPPVDGDATGAADRGNGTGPPDGAGGGSDAGPPDDAGPADDAGNETA